ncbi:hypothetical protein AAG906_024608 [Vitis piasezkii]
MLVSSGAPLNLWEEAILSACQIQKRVVYEIKKFLGSKFDIKDLGEAEAILGIKITRTPNELKLSKEHYVKKILRKFEHFDCKPDHWTVVHKVLKYLRGTINYGLCYSEFPSVLKGFSDANWISDSDEIKSTSGYVFTLSESAVSWKSAKKTCITRNLLENIPLWMRLASFISMHCDSQAVITKAKSKIFNGKNMYICLRHNIVRQLLETRVIFLEFVRSKLNLVDLLIKPLNKKLVEETSRGMRLRPITKVKSGGSLTY